MPVRAAAAAEPVAQRVSRQTLSWRRITGTPYRWVLWSFAALQVLELIIGSSEFRLGAVPMWINLLTSVTLLGAMLMFSYLRYSGRDSAASARSAAALASQWIAFSLAFDAVFGIVLLPVIDDKPLNLAFFRGQAPWIWISYAVLALSGFIGWLIYVLSMDR
jgi:hypothetical protein